MNTSSSSTANELLKARNETFWVWKTLSQVALAVLTILLYLPPLYRVGMIVDIPSHIAWAEELALTGQTNLPHYLFQQVIVIVRVLIPFQIVARILPSAAVIDTTWNIAGLATALIFTIFLAEMIYLRLLKFMARWHSPLAFLAGMVLTISLLLVGPVTIFTWWQGRLYYGYVGINLFHSPTMLLLKPLALALFWMICSQFSGSSRLRPIIILAILSILVLHAKPNYTVALLPALGLIGVYTLFRRKNLNWKAIGFGVFIPSILVLIYQYLITFGEEKADVVFAPFLVMSDFMTRNDFLPLWVMLPLFLLSILFPLVAAFLYYRRKEDNFPIELAWLTFFVGAALTYLFAETGIRQGYGNFLWSGQIALFVLFVESVFLVLHRLANEPQPRPFNLRLAITGTALLLHLISGIFFYIQEILHPATMW